MQDNTTQTISRPYTDRAGSEHPKKALEMVALILSILIVILLFPASLLFIFRVTQQYERAVIFRLGRLKKGAAKGPGLLYVLPCIDDFIKVDLRTVTFDVPSQEVLTRDSCSVAVDAVVYYRVEQPLEAVLRVTHYKQASWTLAATTLRNVLGQKTLAEILIERETLSNLLQSILDHATHTWGVKIERVEIKDVRLPTQMQRAMAAEAEAMREARALLIAADGELRAAQNLKNASAIISSSPAALKLRYLQTVTNIASEKETKIVFPVPLAVT